MTPWTTAPWTPRAWQAEALPIARRALREGCPVIRAVTGAGKSILIAELAHEVDGRTLVTTPTVKLVDQLADTLRARGLEVGKFYTKAKQTRHPVIVCCNDSLASLAERIDPPDLWIVDECHKSECDQIKDVILGARDFFGERDGAEAWVPAARVGFTATPYRADEAEKLSLFDHLAYDYGPGRAMRDGVVVRPDVRHYQGEATDLDTACVEMIQGGISRGLGPGIVDAINIDDAKHFADLLQAHGLRAKEVHSRLNDATVERRIQQLERGDLDTIVHVSLLSEGVDFPWLRWLCCRRPISSRVLFAQYIGRGLRVHPGKDRCVVYDPQDLFGKLSLDYEAILSGGIEDDDEIPMLPALEVDWVLEALTKEDLQDTLRGVPVRMLDPTVSYIRRTRLAFQALGVVPMTIGGDAEWRREDPTQHQLTRIGRDAGLATYPDIPPEHSRALRVACRAIGGCDRGTASDLISILNALRYGWPVGVDSFEEAV